MLREFLNRRECGRAHIVKRFNVARRGKYARAFFAAAVVPWRNCLEVLIAKLGLHWSSSSTSSSGGRYNVFPVDGDVVDVFCIFSRFIVSEA